MLEFIAEHGLLLVLAEFACLFLIFSVWEGAHPYVRPPFGELQASRQITNLALFVCNQPAIYVLSWSLVWWFAEFSSLGFLNGGSVSQPLQLVVGILLLDATSYLRHRIMHTRWLWPTHAAHHSDVALDWTTEFRFHPIEALLSTFLQIAVVVLCGIPGFAVACFAIIGLAVGCFQHANVGFSARVDAFIERALVTPRMHRVHHAKEDGQYDANFGFVLPWWDWLFGTYQRPGGERAFGVEALDAQSPLGLGRLLTLPFHYLARPATDPSQPPSV